MRSLGFWLVLLAQLVDAQETRSLTLNDGRRIEFSAQKEVAGGLEIETTFGPLFIAEERLASRGTNQVKSASRELRSTRGQWILFESDLDEARHNQLAQSIETFAAFLKDHYQLQAQDLTSAPYRVRAWRRRSDFKQAQDRLAPAISRLKGQAFAEGVAGFFAPDLVEVQFWDGANELRGERTELAQHEVTHLFNHLLARAMKRLQMPCWFEEGTAVYFSMTIGLETTNLAELQEPLDHEASLYEVLGDLRAKSGYGVESLLAVPYASFYGREYSWSWALLRQLRQAEKGRYWPLLLQWLKDGQKSSLMKTLGVSEKKFQGDWHRSLEKAAPSLAKLQSGKQKRLLDAVRATLGPTKEQSESFQSIARSYATVEMAELALAYFEAAERGGVDCAEDRLVVAGFRARLAGIAEDELWPEDARADLEKAIELDPLLPQLRFVHGEQLALAGAATAAKAEIGLSLLLAFPDDDIESRALSLLRLFAADGDDALLAHCSRLLPNRQPTFEKAFVYLLQEQGQFLKLHQLLSSRQEQGLADADEALMLADLKMLMDQSVEAAKILRELLAAEPKAHHLRPRLAQALVDSGDSEAARALFESTRTFAGEAGLDLGFVLRRIAEILEGR